jgi:hypothetical protein
MPKLPNIAEIERSVEADFSILESLAISAILAIPVTDNLI